MKRKVAGVLTALLVLCSATTVFAAGSSDAESVIKEKQELEAKSEELTASIDVSKSTAVTTDGKAVTVNFEKLDADTLKTATTEAKKASEQADVLCSAEVTVPAGTDISKGMTITLYSSKIKAGANIYLYHLLSSGKWDVIVPTVADGYVTAKVYSLSPITVVEYPSNVSLSSTGYDSNQKISELSESYQSQIDDLTSKLSAASSQVTELKNANAASNETITSLKTQIADLSGQITALKGSAADAAKLESLETKVTDLVAKVSELNGKLSVMTSEKKDDKANQTASTATTDTNDNSSKSGNASTTSNANNKQTVNVNVTGSSSGSTGGSSSSTSPKTGNALPAVLVLLAVAVATIVAVRKSKVIRL